ncbi:MAG: hypothetical protein R8M70_01975 [Alphaproteobacteria bacterium]|nr:hypothetical protein [Alphaproteobacteria bacterium]
MRFITVSILSVLVVMPTVTMARLPVVNIASAGVSARSAFGEEVTKTYTKAAESTRTRSVVARTIQKPITATPVDTGEQLLTVNDVLVPQRPSGDLWAKNDTNQTNEFALRMPTANEFSVIRSDSLLPEESIDKKIVVAPAPVPAPVLASMAKNNNKIESAKTPQKRTSARNASNKTVVTAKAKTQGNSAQNTTPSKNKDVIVRNVKKKNTPRIIMARDDMTNMNPAQLRQAFRKTFLSENKHLSTYPAEEFDVASNMSATTGRFSSQRDLSEDSSIRPLEIKIRFRNDDSALSRENYNLLMEYAGIVVRKPTRAIQLGIPKRMTKTKNGRKLAARRLAIVEQVLTDNGVSQQHIVPVLSNDTDSGLTLRIISNDQYEALSQQQRDVFGDDTGNKTSRMSW